MDSFYQVLLTYLDMVKDSLSLNLLDGLCSKSDKGYLNRLNSLSDFSFMFKKKRLLGFRLWRNTKKTASSCCWRLAGPGGRSCLAALVSVLVRWHSPASRRRALSHCVYSIKAECRAAGHRDLNFIQQKLPGLVMVSGPLCPIWMPVSLTACMPQPR